METSTAKNNYAAPSAEVFKVALENVVCGTTVETAGAPTYNGFSSEQEW